jgi:hypothetical protein
MLKWVNNVVGNFANHYATPMRKFRKDTAAEIANLFTVLSQLWQHFHWHLTRKELALSYCLSLLQNDTS